jgi:pheromone shutdown protein TraB
MITLLGVGHVFDLSRRIREEIHGRRPPVVGLELDELRFQSLTRGGTRVGEGPLTYRILAFTQRSIAEQYGMDVGGEMIAAAQAAQEVGARLALIDMDARRVWARLWAAMSLGEKARLFFSSLAGMVAGREKVEEELRMYQGDSEGYIEGLAKQFPAIKRVLIDERNEHMGRALRKLHEEFGDVVAVVGDGHVDGIVRHLGGTEVRALRLWDLREEARGDSARVSYDLVVPKPPAEDDDHREP